MTFCLFLKEFLLSDKNIKISSFKSSENIQKKEGGPDPLISADRLFHSRIVLGKKDFEKISWRIKGTRSELFLRRLYASVLWGIILQICLR